MADSFIKRFRGEEEVSYIHPALEPILRNTKGVMLFQEQVLRVAVEIAGLTWGEADVLRRGMTKFRVDMMDQLKSKFIAGCCRLPPEGIGMDRRSASTLWEQVRAFSGYGFNQGHATSYARISYQMAQLKAHHPAAFLCARLKVGGGYHHPAVYMQEARRCGYRIYPPHVNFSQRRFSLAAGGIQNKSRNDGVFWMGLDRIRDLRKSAIQKLIRERQDSPFSSVQNLIERVQLQTREIRNLIICGGLDGLGESRNAMLEVIEGRISTAATSQLSLWSEHSTTVDPEDDRQRFDWEMEILGAPVSVTPLDIVELNNASTKKVSEITKIPGEQLNVAGYRIPGWPGGEGFFLADSHQYIQVKMDSAKGISASSPRSWLPVILEGKWEEDEWGMGWLRAKSWDELRVFGEEV
jgi:DNA polymerase III alpha subunit